MNNIEQFILPNCYGIDEGYGQRFSSFLCDSRLFCVLFVESVCLFVCLHGYVRKFIPVVCTMLNGSCYNASEMQKTIFKINNAQ